MALGSEGVPWHTRWRENIEVTSGFALQGKQWESESAVAEINGEEVRLQAQYPPPRAEMARSCDDH